MDLSVVIVSWNVRDLLTKLLESIFHYTSGLNYEVIIIDNDSKDGTVEKLHQEFQPWIAKKQLQIIDNRYNAGFAKANNQGLKVAQGKFVLFMNPDMELLENSFQIMKNFMDKSPNIGASSCRLLYADKTVQPNIKKFPSLCSQVLILLKLHHFFSWLPCLKKYLNKDFNYSEHAYVEQIMGAFIFTRHDLMQKINGWDEDYWLWWEDVELCKNIKDQEQEIVYTPITEIIHYEGKSFEQTSGLKKQKRFNKGMLLYFRKHHSKVSYYILLILQPLSYILVSITKLFHIKQRPQSRI